MEKRYYSEATMVAHEMAQDLFEIGAITEAEMKKYDEMCFVEEPKEIKVTANPIKTGRPSHASA